MYTKRQLLPANRVKLQLHDAINWLRFHSKSLIHILSLSNSHNDVASIQKNRGDKSHHVIVALAGFNNESNESIYDSESETNYQNNRKIHFTLQHIRLKSY